MVHVDNLFGSSVPETMFILHCEFMRVEFMDHFETILLFY